MDELQNKGQVTIHIDGKYGGEPLTPENYDITLMQTVLEHAIALLDLVSLVCVLWLNRTLSMGILTVAP